jgi:signal transduction histidine kinase
MRALDPLVKDGALALGLGVLVVVEVIPLHGFDGFDASPPAGWPVLAAAMIAPLAWRRREPVAMLGVQGVAELATVSLSGHFAFSDVMGGGLLVGAYSAGAFSQRRGWSLAVVIAAGVAPDLLTSPRWIMGGGSPGLFPVIPLTAWLIGHSVRARRRRIADLQERALRVQGERDATLRAAIVEERARIARELHDVVAHGVAMMVVQAEGARKIMRRAPDQAEEALRTVSAAGSEALGELRHLLGVLADDTKRSQLEPAPGLADLAALVRRVEAAGLLVELHLDGEVRPLARGLELTAYRIVQEALTNVLKHAAASRAVVRLLFADDSLHIEVTDAGRGRPQSNGTGRGLVGMRERVTAYGGELRVGPRPGGGYAVSARLPLGTAPDGAGTEGSSRDPGRG